MWSRALLGLAALAAAVACRVAAEEPKAQHVDGKLVARDGKAEFTFGKWRLYFEGVPTNSAGARVAFQYPTKSGSGTSGKSNSSFDGVKVSQKWDEKANEIAVEGFSFKLLGKAEKLAFKDRTYTAADTTQTIIIDKDGKTRLADKK